MFELRSKAKSHISVDACARMSLLPPTSSLSGGRGGEGTVFRVGNKERKSLVWLMIELYRVAMTSAGESD